jgi:plasmid stability protein
MAVLTVRNLPEETHRALRVRAAHHGRSTEAEVRAILEEAVRPIERVHVGSELAAFGSQWGGVEIDIARDREAMRGAAFE